MLAINLFVQLSEKDCMGKKTTCYDLLLLLLLYCRYVRHGVLYGMGMLLWATPNHILLGDLSMGVAESVSWMKEVAENDPDLKSRTLAAHALSILSTIK